MNKTTSLPHLQWFLSVVCFTLSFVLLLPSVAGHCDEISRPPIILITVDTLRADHLSCYGYPRQTSPAIDSIAQDGVLYLDAHVTTTTTSPSLISIMSGLYPKSHRATELRIKADPSLKFLAQTMKEAGYSTAGICGQYNCHRSIGFARGFDHYDDEFELLPGERKGFNFAHEGDFHPEAERRAADLVTRSVDWLETRPREKPFFLWLHFMDPHLSYSPPPPFDTAFTDTPPRWRDGPKTLPLERINPHAATTGKTEVAYYVNRYDGEIRYLDNEIGRLISYLQSHDLYKDSLIIFTSDHGEYMGEYESKSPAFSHGGTLFESETRAPFIVKYPAGAQAGTKTGAVISSVDIAPTLSAYIGRRMEITDGVDIRTLPENSPRTIFIQRPHASEAGFAAYSSGYKLVVDTGVTQDENAILISNGILRKEKQQLLTIEAGTQETRSNLTFNPAQVSILERELFDWLKKEPPLSLASSKVERDDSAENIKRLKTLGYLQ